MLCVIPFFSGDVRQAKRLLAWIADLGGCRGHDCLLVADAATPWDDALECYDSAKASFDSVVWASNERTVDGWIPGSNSLFRVAAEWAQRESRAFLFLEPDAVPLKSGWLDTIASAYEIARHQTPFMGSLVYHQNPEWPNPYLEGVAVYPFDAWRRMEANFRTDLSWTRACAPAVVPLAVNSPLFQHLWGEVGNPPIFAERNVPGTNVFCLAQIKAEAALFHRQKDGSLIRLLRRQRGIEDSPTSQLLVVLPFCNKDAPMFSRNLDWWLELDGKIPFDCLLSFEAGTLPHYLADMKERATRLFESVREVEYPRPPARTWPPTIAFIQTARAVQNFWDGPWFWTEFDLIPLRRGWVQTLWAEYCRAGKPFMGPIVHTQGHMNGTGFYPADTPARIPRAMQDVTVAWDVAMKGEMMRDCHDCGGLLQHVWVVDHRGRFQPSGGGAEPSFRNPAFLGQLLPSAVAFHRQKDGTLIQRLRERTPKCAPTSSLSPA